jgi:hypothetical protein
MKTRAGAGFKPARSAFLRSAPLGLSLTGLSLTGLSLTGLALITATCLLVAGCSPGADYPSIFPAVHDMPPPRTDAPMDQVQVQKATEDLISQRDHLNAEAPPSKPASGSAGQVTGSTAKKPAHKAPAQQASAAPPATTASAQGAGINGAGIQGAGASGTAGAGLKP